MKLKRIFKHGTIELGDPNPEWDPEKIREFYTAGYPGLRLTTTEGPEFKGDAEVYTFRQAIGTKGTGATVTTGELLFNSDAKAEIEAVESCECALILNDALGEAEHITYRPMIPPAALQGII